ncbi:hypothetical protein VNO77_43822 [Canavalia gladiata]|uniref:Uncharacterized protein n=1 Tax=Canavalia gladiata TaxID=3824 RepID=A0AAN9JUU4_CANGL
MKVEPARCGLIVTSCCRFISVNSKSGYQASSCNICLLRSGSAIMGSLCPFGIGRMSGIDSKQQEAIVGPAYRIAF